MILRYRRLLALARTRGDLLAIATLETVIARLEREELVPQRRAA